MKKINKPGFIIIIIVIIIIIISAYKNNFYSINSKEYLTSKGETASFEEKHNEINTKDGASFDFYKFKGKWTLMELTSAKGSEIEIIDTSKISNGTLYIVVLDSDYKDIQIIHKSSENSYFNFTIPEDGTYLIRLVGENACGSFNVKITSDNDITLIHKDIFN